jgi:hypothetical protein
VPEVIGRFTSGEATSESTDPATQAWNCSLGSLAQIGLELSKRHLNRVQVRRIFGQIAKRRAARLDRLANPGGLMRRKAVNHDNILALERRGQTLFDISQEFLSGHRAVNGLRRCHAMPPQRGHEGDCLPVPLRHAAHQPLTAGTAAIQPHHLGVGGCLIDEHQPGRVKQALFSHPAPPGARHVGAFLLRRAQGFF